MNKRKIYTSQFKREAVRLMESLDRRASDVVRQLGVRRNQLYKWKEPFSALNERSHWIKPAAQPWRRLKLSSVSVAPPNESACSNVDS